MQSTMLNSDRPSMDAYCAYWPFPASNLGRWDWAREWHPPIKLQPE
jgi:hypothetical protein